MRVLRWVSTVLFIVVSFWVDAQCADSIASPVQRCKFEKFEVEDASDINYCDDAINGSVRVGNVLGFSNISAVFDASYIVNNGKLIGFLSDFNHNKVICIHHLEGLDVIDHIDTLNIPIEGPSNIKMVKDIDGVWYLFVIEAKKKQVLRCKLSVDFKVLSIDVVSTNEQKFSSIDFINVQNVWYMVSTYLDTRLFFYKVGVTLDETSDFELLKSIPIPSSVVSPIDIDLFTQCDTVYASIIGLNKEHTIVKMENLNANLSLTSIFKETLSLGIETNLWRHEIVKVNASGFQTIYAGQKGVYQTEFSMNMGVITAGNIRILSQGNNLVLGLGVIRLGNQWRIKTIDKNKYETIILEDTTCGYSDGKYVISGNKSVSYSIIENGETKLVRQGVVVTNDSVPIIFFTENENCLSIPTSFTTLSNKPITTYTWDFGDGGTAGVVDPLHQYASVGDYPVSIIVEDTDGCKNTFKDTVSIYNDPVTDFTFPSLLCTNNDIIFTNTSTGETGNTVKWNWSIDNIKVDTLKDFKTSFPANGTLKIKLKAEIPGCKDSVSQTVTIIPGPIVHFEATENCLSDSVKFNNSTVGNNITQTLWNFGDGQTSLLENPTVLYDTAQTFLISLAVSNQAGCNNYFDTNFTVRPLPVVDFDNGISCSKDSTEFYDRSNITFDTINSYKWLLDNNLISSNQNPNIYIEDIQPHFIKLIAKSDKGCTDSLTKAIVTTQSPQITIETIEDCFGKSTTFNDLSTDISQITDREWSVKGSGITSSANTFKNLFEQVGSKTVYLSLISSTGCKAYDSTIIQISPLPTPTFSNSKVCKNDSVLFYQTSVSTTDPIATTKWFFESIGFVEGDTVKVKFNQLGNQKFILDITTQNGCKNSVSTNVDVLESPNALFILNNNIGKAPLAVLATPALATGTHTWLDGLGNTSSTSNYNPVYSQNGIYSLTHIISNAKLCTDTVSKNVFVGDFSIDLSIDGIGIKDSLTEKYITLSLTNNSPINITNPVFNIDLGNEIIFKSQIQAIIKPNQSTVYLLPLGILANQVQTLNYICISIDPTYLEDKISKNNSQCIILNNDFKIETPYPNPTNNLISFDVYSPSNQIAIVKTYTLLGKLLNKKTYNLTKGNNKIVEPLTTLNSGLYLIDINIGTKHKTYKITKK